jgi:hypothetical protein
MNLSTTSKTTLDDLNQCDEQMLALFIWQGQCYSRSLTMEKKYVTTTGMWGGEILRDI